MKTAGQRTILVIALLLSVAVVAAAQGLHWKSTTTAMGKEMKNEFYFMPKMVKTVSDNGEVVILRIDKQLIYTLNPAEKQYSETTFDDFDRLMNKMADKTKGASDKMKEKLKNLPEAQRKMMEGMRGGLGKETPAETKNTGEKKTIAGYNCTKYLIVQGEKELMTVWTTQDVKEFAGMKKDFEEFSKRMTGRMPGMGSAIEQLMKLPGFAMETQMGTMMTQTVTSIEKQSTPAAEFDIPAGYAKVKSKLQEQLEAPGKQQD